MVIKTSKGSREQSAASGITGIWYAQNAGGDNRYEFAQEGDRLSGNWFLRGKQYPLTGVMDGNAVSLTVTNSDGKHQIRGEIRGKELHWLRGGHSLHAVPAYRRIDAFTLQSTNLAGVLLGAHRPGRYHYGCVTPDIVEAWIDDMKWVGIKTIICLLAGEEFAPYMHLHSQSLLGMYRRAGFTVISRPGEDDYWPIVPADVLDEIGQDFKKAEKPVLVHCSSGEERTGRVIEYLDTLSGSGKEHGE